MNKEEQVVQYFYDNYGWVNKEGISGEDTLFRQFSPPYYPYHVGVDSRTMDCFSNLNGKLLLAGGGDLPESHVKTANKFSETTCLDISKVAIDIARRKLEGRGEFIVGSILNIPTPSDYFDACFCAHVIYHIERDHQARAIRELIRVIKPGGRIVVIYRNPVALPYLLFRLTKKLRLHKVLRRKKRYDRPNAQSPNAEIPPPLYYFAHPLKWWTQFEAECDIAITPWDVMSNEEEDVIFLNDTIASLGYRLCSWLENKHPDQAASWWSYPMIVLTKMNGDST
jgi:SAM-dependent methyltransferase